MTLAFLTVKNEYKIKINFNFSYFKKFKFKKFVNSNIDSFSNIKSSAISNLFLTLMTSVDIIVFRKLFPNELSGFYSAISTLGKIPLFLSAILFTYFFN
jgi:O-antigen/teichoic acid export membrane protein